MSKISSHHLVGFLRSPDFYVTAAVLLIGLVAGLAIPLVGYVVPLVVGAITFAVGILVMPVVAIVWLMLVLVFLVTGQLTFFFGISQAMWLPYLLLLLMGFKFLLNKLQVVPLQRVNIAPSGASYFLLSFCLIFLQSAAINKTDVFSIGVAAKNYIFPWLFTILIASSVRSDDELRKVWHFMIWIVVLQVPFAIVQHFYYAKLAGASWDAVVGTFGGKYKTGGASGTMAIYIVFGIVLAASMYRRSLINKWILFGVVSAGMAVIALAEVKIFLVCMPVALMILFWRDMYKNPFKFLGAGFSIALLLGIILFAYQQTYSEKLSKTRTVDGLFEYILAVESDPNAFNRETKELSRVGAVLMWARHNKADSYQFYFGNGPAASRESQTLGTGVAARKFPFTLSTSAASTMLWDVGLLGYMSFLGVLFFAAIGAFTQAKYVSQHTAAVLDSLGVMLLLSVPLSLYNRDLIDSAATQVQLALWLGYILLTRRSIKELKS